MSTEMTPCISNWPRHLINTCPKAIGPVAHPITITDSSVHHHRRLQPAPLPTFKHRLVCPALPFTNHIPVRWFSLQRQTTHILVPSPLCQPTLVFPGLVASGLCLGCSQALVPCALENPTLQEEKAVTQLHPKQGAHRAPGLNH